VGVKPIGSERMPLWPCNQYVRGPFVWGERLGSGVSWLGGVSDLRKTVRNRRQNCSDCTVNWFHVFWPILNQRACVIGLYWSRERRVWEGW